MRRSERGRRRSAGRRVAVAVAVAIVPVGLAACGNDNKDKGGGGAKASTAPTPLAITTSDAGSKRFKTVAPKTVKGGLVKLTFTNAGKEEHEAQLYRIDGNHSTKEILKLAAGNKEVTPDWLHFAGGASGTPPGQTGNATLKLPAGKYVTFDGGSGDGPPPALSGAIAEFEVTAGGNAALPASTATITATTDEQAKPPDSFQASGLKVGKNRLRFVTKGEQPHLVLMAPILPGKKLADVKKFLSQQGRPSGPPPVDFKSSASTAVLDGDTEEVTDIELRKPGKYALVCYLKDRDGKGKRHFADGMLKQVDVK